MTTVNAAGMMTSTGLNTLQDTLGSITTDSKTTETLQTIFMHCMRVKSLQANLVALVGISMVSTIHLL